MKPVYTAIIRRGDRKHLLSFPTTIQAVEAAQAALGYTPGVDEEDDDAVIEYRSRIRATPDADILLEDVHRTAVCMSKFTPAQVRSLKILCHAFGLSYGNVRLFLSYLCLAKQMRWEDIAEYGISPCGYPDSK